MNASVRELTPRGRGSVTVIEVTGPEARALLGTLAQRLPEPGELSVTKLIAGDELLEDAVIACESNERLELHLTGSPPLVRKALELLEANSAQRQGNIEARAEAVLAVAASEMGARILLDQMQGALRSALESHREDSEVEWEAFVLELLENARVAMPAIYPKRVALAGEVNAGKSTLFNLLVGSERVIVSEQPGTTRDAVISNALFGEWPVILIDTAGDRDLEGALSNSDQIQIERAGQEVGRFERDGADLVLWLGANVDEVGKDQDPIRTRTLVSRADEREPISVDLARSFSSHADPEAARRLVRAEFQAFFHLPDSAWVPDRPVPFEPNLCSALRASLVSPSPRAEVRHAPVFEILGLSPD
ncbi:MAG: tRNA U34 5-carboxymethylaminomethyl modifying GTPase MnmE/TrmE [Planctomycetota bacterium]